MESFPLLSQSQRYPALTTPASSPGNPAMLSKMLLLAFRYVVLVFYRIIIIFINDSLDSFDGGPAGGGCRASATHQKSAK